MKLTSPDRAALRALVTRPPTPTDLKRSLGVETATRRWLVCAVMPLWLGAGLADWYRHKQTHIEDTAGARESMIHSLMMTEAGIPVTLGLFCEVNPRRAGRLRDSAGSIWPHRLLGRELRGAASPGHPG
jgi:hypothetical protein